MNSWILMKKIRHIYELEFVIFAADQNLLNLNVVP